MTVLVTGYEPFGGDADNPSADIVAGLATRADLMTARLPVVYRSIDDEIAELLDRHQPSAVLLLGLGETDGVRLEQVAINLDDTPSADNAGEIRQRQPIEDDGPVAYRSTLPLESMAELADAMELPVQWSRDAGGFLCNHVFYRARHLLSSQGFDEVRCGFVHVGRSMPVTRMIPFFDRTVELLAR